MQKTIYRFIFAHSLRQQMMLLLLTFAAFPFLYFSLDLPKTIINQAINGKDFPKEILGYEFDQVPYLIALCIIFLGLVLINGGFKYIINVWKGRLGERMLRRLRYELYSRVLRFPLPHFKRVSQGEIIPMITSEVEPIGGFIGDAVAQPVFQAGQLLTILIFILVQDPVLGLAAVALYPFQGWLIPRMQRRVNMLAKDRVRMVRRLSENIAESISGVQEIRVNHGTRYNRAAFSELLGKIYLIRYEIYHRKFVIKFLNNFIAQLTPFFFYLIGGYLVIKGDLSFGALVAVLAAYKDMSAPWKELLLFYQQKEDARIKYEQVIEQFEPPGILDARLQNDDGREVAPFGPDDEIVGQSVSYLEDGGRTVLENASFRFAVGQHVAILGPAGSGRDELAMILARLLLPVSGRITIAGRDLTHLPDAVVGRRIAYVGPSPYLFSSSIRENILFGLKYRPGAEGPQGRDRQLIVAEAEAAGNPIDDYFSDWVDYETAGVAGPDEMVPLLVDVATKVGLEGDLYHFGLRGMIDPRRREGLAAKILSARAALRERLSDPKLGELVEPYDQDRYNQNASLAENLLFGTPVGPVFDIENLAANGYVRQVLDKTGLTEELVSVGREVAETMVELFGDVDPGQEIFERYSFIKAEDLPEFQGILARSARSGMQALSKDDRARLLSLTFLLVPARHRLGVLGPDLQARIIEARRMLARDLPDSLRAAIEFFDADRYNAAASLQDNILLGKVAHGHAHASDRVADLIGEVVDEVDARREVIEVGLDHQVGIGGGRLGLAQRQKVVIARAILKRPCLMIMHDAAAPFDSASRTVLLDRVLDETEGRGVIWVADSVAHGDRFDSVILMQGGRITAQGSYEELKRGADGASLAAE